MGISLGLVGLSSFGRAFADLFMSHPEVDRIALCDLEQEGSFEQDAWVDKDGATPLDADAMRDPLPGEVVEAFRTVAGEGYLGGHGGSHAYLVHEFVDAVAHDRVPAVSVWDAVRYMAAGATAHKSALRDGEILEVPDWGDPPR